MPRVKPPAGTWVKTMFGTGIVGDDGDIHLNGTFILNGKKTTVGLV